jgi:hypothetical protein
VDPRAGLDAVEKRETSPLPGIEPRPPSLQLPTEMFRLAQNVVESGDGRGLENSFQ